MILVDTALRKREEAGDPVRVAMVGAGFMGRGIALQIEQSTPGMRMVAISNRNLKKAEQTYREAGVESTRRIHTAAELDNAINAGTCAVTDKPETLCDAEGVEAIIEVTGAVEFSAGVVTRAIERGKHVIMMNAELDGTVGPILKVKADEAGVVISNSDGDQPGVIMNLYRFVKGIGVRPILCGNIKGLQDPYRNPTTQKGFAEKWGQKPHMVTSFADGTKISFEQAIVANATGMTVAKRGMYGPTVPSGTPLQEAVLEFPLDEFIDGPGIVDYVVGAVPGPGVFVLGTHDHPLQQHYLHLYKLGTGPAYLFYTPYHLCHFEVPNSVARAVLFGDAVIAPQGHPQVDVVATAKTRLQAGTVLDGLGYYKTYGQCETAETTVRDRLLPIGLAEGCTLIRDIEKDEVLTYEDVKVPKGRLSDALRREQDQYFFS